MMSTNTMYPRFVLYLVIGHSVILGLHAAAHNVLGVQLTDFQMLFVTVAMIVVPVLAAILVWTRFQLVGSWLLLLGMLASFIFGFLSHFILSGVDNVFTVPSGDWRPVFQITTVLLGVMEIVSILLVARALTANRRARS